MIRQGAARLGEKIGTRVMHTSLATIKKMKVIEGM